MADAGRAGPVAGTGSARPILPRRAAGSSGPRRRSSPTTAPRRPAAAARSAAIRKAERRGMALLLCGTVLMAVLSAWMLALAPAAMPP
jgi:hypothetical protein